LVLGLSAQGRAQSISFTLFSPPTVDSPKGLVASSDGNIWFTLFGANKISKVTPGGVFTEYTLPSPSSGPYQITNGSDGALWFTEFQNSTKQVGKITTAGVITEYSIPDAGGITPRALGIATGSDGALWVTCPNTSQIARVSTAGQVTTYALPSSYSPSAITAGPDGALWFAENGTLGAVGRISTDGVVTHYPLPSSVAGTLTAITNGPDGALWFIDSLTQGPKIGRITTKGETTFFDAPGAFSSLVAGPDGALWYVGGGLTVGRMTTSGSVTTYNCNGQVIASSSSGACFPDQAARGPNGTIWFTDLKRGYIVQGTVGGLTVTGLSPTSAAEGATTDLKLTVNGTGFAAGAGVWWNGRQLLTDFVNGGQLIATVPSSFLAAGSVTIYVVNPGQGTSNSVNFTVTTTTVSALAVTTSANLPLGVIGSTYSQPLGAKGGAPPYKWSVASGSLPAGLSLAADGTLTGVPTSVGTSSFTVNLADSGTNTLTQGFNVTVYPAVAFTTSALRIPQVADGAGWNTRFAIVNLDSSAVTYTFQFWNDAGQALALPILGGTPGVATGSIAPGGIDVGGARLLHLLGDRVQVRLQ